MSRDMFDKAQIRLKVKAVQEERNYVGWDESDRAFYNVFYCGDCGRKMTTCRTRGHVEYFCQASRYEDERKCQTKNISEDKLQKIVRSELSRQFQLLKIKKKDMTAISRSVLEEQLSIIRKELDKMEIDYQKISDQWVQSFLMYKEGKTSLQAYLDTKKERSDWETFFQERKKTLEQKMCMLQKQQKEEAKFLRSLLELEGASRLNAELVEALVDRISLYGDGHLEIVFKFQGVMADDRLLIGYYCLSMEDDTDNESNSITNQRLLIKDYISTIPELSAMPYQEFYDDGYSGASMERPAMQQILQLVRENRVQCIVVKDFSRFSRNYIEMGTYLEQFFPFMGIRFISVSDHYDSLEL